MASWWSDFVAGIGFGTEPGRKAMQTPVSRGDRPTQFSDEGLQRIDAAAKYVVATRSGKADDDDDDASAGALRPPPERERTLAQARGHLDAVVGADARRRNLGLPDYSGAHFSQRQDAMRDVKKREIETLEKEPERYRQALRDASDAVMDRTDLSREPVYVPYDERGPLEAPALRRSDAVVAHSGAGRPISIPSVDLAKMRELEIEKARRQGASETKLRVMREQREPTKVELRILFKEKLLTEDGRFAFDRFLRSQAGSDTHKILGDCASFLGRGAFGTVAKFCEGKPVRRDPAQTPYCYSDVCIAVKFQPHGPESERELGMMRMLTANEKTRPFVVELLGSRVIDDLVAIPLPSLTHRPTPKRQISVAYMTVYEAPYNTLSDFIERAPEAEVEAKMPGLVQQVMRAVAVLRREFPHLRHNDLSPNNVFLDGPGCERAVIGDWGLARDVKPFDVTRDMVLWHWQPVGRSMCDFEPLWARMYDDPIRMGRLMDERTVHKHFLAYTLPMDCEYYDWFFFLFWVRRQLQHRGVTVRVVDQIYNYMFDNDFVLRMPHFGVLVADERDDESCTTSYAPYPGRLTGHMQHQIQRAVSGRRLPTVADVYTRTFGPVDEVADDDDF